MIPPNSICISDVLSAAVKVGNMRGWSMYIESGSMISSMFSSVKFSIISFGGHACDSQDVPG